MDQPSAAAIMVQQVAWSMVARQLAGFSDGIEVVTPDAVREHLDEIGQGLVRRHTG